MGNTVDVMMGRSARRLKIPGLEHMHGKQTCEHWVQVESLVQDGTYNRFRGYVVGLTRVHYTIEYHSMIVPSKKFDGSFYI